MSTETVRDVPIAEAAVQMGITAEALRKRIQRGTQRASKRGGQWYVLVDLDGQPDGGQDRGQEGRQNGHNGAGPSGHDVHAALIEQLQSEVLFLRQELARHSQIVAGLVQRIPELPASRDPQASPLEASGSRNGRPWWRLWG